jgi:hypothetical protein
LKLGSSEPNDCATIAVSKEAARLRFWVLGVKDTLAEGSPETGFGFLNLALEFESRFGNFFSGVVLNPDILSYDFFVGSIVEAVVCMAA